MVQAFGAFFSTLSQSYVGLTLFYGILAGIAGFLGMIGGLVKVLTAALLVLEGVLQIISGLIASLLGMFAAFVDALFGTSLTESLINGGAVLLGGGMESLVNAFKALGPSQGPNFGGYTNMGFQQALGPDAMKLLYKQGQPFNFTQINNVNIPTTANAAETSTELDKWIAAQRNAAFEKAQAAGVRK